MITVAFYELIEDIEVHLPIGQVSSLGVRSNKGYSLMDCFIWTLMIGAQELPARENQGILWFF